MSGLRSRCDSLALPARRGVRCDTTHRTSIETAALEAPRTADGELVCGEALPAGPRRREAERTSRKRGRAWSIWRRIRGNERDRSRSPTPGEEVRRAPSKQPRERAAVTTAHLRQAAHTPHDHDEILGKLRDARDALRSAVAFCHDFPLDSSEKYGLSEA